MAVSGYCMQLQQLRGNSGCRVFDLGSVRAACGSRGYRNKAKISQFSRCLVTVFKEDMTDAILIDEETGEIVTSLSQIADEANELYDLAQKAHESSVDYAWRCGEKLLEAKALLKHGEWLPWLAENFSGTRQHAARYMKISANVTRVLLLPESERPESIRQALRLLSKPDKGAHQHITSSESVEWYTPQIYVDAARAVMGGIDLDPASNETANKIVKAKRFFSIDDDGLRKPWRGRVWLNPPYGKVAASFVENLCLQYSSGFVQQAVLLVNSNSNDTLWFRPLWDQLLCFSYGRVNFYGPSSEESGPTHGSCFVYFGENKAAFIEEFSRFGAVVKRA